jgi:hypothetical protein
VGPGDSKPTLEPSPVVPAGSPEIDPATITLICIDAPGTAYGFVIEDCPGMIYSVLAELGPRAKGATRIQAGYVCPDFACSYNTLVGFADGHVEGIRVHWPADSLYQDATPPWPVGPSQPLDASVSPWATGASFDSPPIARPTLPIKTSSEFTGRKALPYCGDDSAHQHDWNALQCFVGSVLAGRPAEVIVDGPCIDSCAWAFSDYRFTGSGAVVRYDGEETGTPWSGPHAGILFVYGEDSFEVPNLPLQAHWGT